MIQLQGKQNTHQLDEIVPIFSRTMGVSHLNIVYMYTVTSLICISWRLPRSFSDIFHDFHTLRKSSQILGAWFLLGLNKGIDYEVSTPLSLSYSIPETKPLY